MKNELKIESLVYKFNIGAISLDELAALIAFLKHHEPDNAMLELYQKTWDNASNYSVDIKSQKIYNSISQKLKLNQNGSINNIGKENVFSPGLQFWSSTMKYAAIFVLAFGLSWVLHNLFTRNATESYTQQYQKIEVPYGSKSEVELPDGTRITLNSGSNLRYPVQFGTKTRTVYLQGEAFFEVKKDKLKPFFVNTSGISIKVLGTTFNVKAYPEEKTVETTLLTGSVEIFTPNGEKDNIPSVQLKPNQKAIYTKLEGIIIEKGKIKNEVDSIQVIPQKISSGFLVQNKVKTELFTAWKDNRLEFDNERFKDLIVKIERWYDVDIDLNYSALNEARFSGKFDKETIEQAMKALTLVTPFHYEIRKNRITITK
jgi:transmembrane sensor